MTLLLGIGFVVGIALAIVLAAVGIVIGVFSKPAAQRYHKAVGAIFSAFAKLGVVALGIGIVAFVVAVFWPK